LTGIWEAPGAGRSGALHKVVVSRQHLIVRLNGHDQDSPPDAYLPAARPYGIARMAWALWREVPDLALVEAISFAMEARREGQTEVLVTPSGWPNTSKGACSPLTASWRERSGSNRARAALRASAGYRAANIPSH
jgi:hypothetical protein